MTSPHPDVAAAILAGGGATRFSGRVKALIEIDGQTILDRQLAVLRSRFDSICIAANDPSPYAGLGLPVIPDRETGHGPLAGIAAALGWCTRDWLMVIACDMPHVSGPSLDLLAAARIADARAVTVIVGDRPEPLFALYHRSCLQAVESLLAQGRRKASGLLRELGPRVAHVPETAARAVDADLRFLANINSPADVS